MFPLANSFQLMQMFTSAGGVSKQSVAAASAAVPHLGPSASPKPQLTFLNIVVPSDLTDHIGAGVLTVMHGPHSDTYIVHQVWRTQPDVRWQPTKENWGSATLSSLGISYQLVNQPRQTRFDVITTIDLDNLPTCLGTKVNIRSSH